MMSQKNSEYAVSPLIGLLLLAAVAVTVFTVTAAAGMYLAEDTETPQNIAHHAPSFSKTNIHHEYCEDYIHVSSCGVYNRADFLTECGNTHKNYGRHGCR